MMEVFKDYSNYKKYENDYDTWKAERNQLQAKKIEYLKNNPVSETETQEAVQRGKVILRSIDVMDEYSQTRSEDTEVLVEQISGEILGYAMSLGMLGGAALVKVLAKKQKIEPNFEQPKNDIQRMLKADSIIPFATGLLCAVAASIPVLSWVAQIQVGASRHGRFEAISKDLKDTYKFAVLDEAQQQKLDEIAKDTLVDKEMKKQLKNRDMDLNPFSPFLSVKELLFQNKQFEADKKEFEEKLEKNHNRIGETISQKDELEAKKDQQILLRTVEKVDIASQDYAENAELATNSVNFLSVFAAIAIGWASSKLVKQIPTKSTFIPKIIPWAIGLGASLIVGAYTTSLQKQASRIGRFTVKKEMEKDPNNFIYVDEEKLKAQPDVPIETPKSQNMFAFFRQLMKDNKEYKKYLKTEAIEEKKRLKALKEIELNDEQINRAKMLQFNTFKTFNKVDDNSQKYSESVEAVGQMVQMPIGTVGSLLGMGLGAIFMAKKMKKNPQLFSDHSKKSAEEKLDMLGSAIPIFIGTLLGGIPSIAVDFYMTKEQKKASRIADMLAIKELSDHREFVDYSQKQPD